MQKIIHPESYRSVHPIFDEIERFYTMTSVKEQKSTNKLIKPCFDSAFVGFYSLFKDFGHVHYNFSIKHNKYPKLDLPKYDPKNVILLFSGGKDSVAAMLYYVKKGYNVYLYHMKHINQSFPNEVEISQQIADYMGLPLYIDDMRYSGHNDWMEHPMKNIIIANGALQYGIHEGITTKIATGNYTNSHIGFETFHQNAGDFVEFWQAYESVIQRIIPKFKVGIVLKNMVQTLKVMGEHKDLLEMSMSCLFPYRWRGQLIRQNEKKYGVKLMPNRCGSCAKCAFEYIYYADKGIIEYNEDFYAHCLDILYRNFEKNVTMPEFDSYEHFFETQFKYPTSKSKMKAKVTLENNRIRLNGKKVS